MYVKYKLLFIFSIYSQAPFYTYVYCPCVKLALERYEMQMQAHVFTLLGMLELMSFSLGQTFNVCFCERTMVIGTLYSMFFIVLLGNTYCVFE